MIYGYKTSKTERLQVEWIHGEAEGKLLLLLPLVPLYRVSRDQWLFRADAKNVQLPTCHGRGEGERDAL